jgi:hypothetical protein
MGRRGGPPSNGRTECLHFIIDDEQLGAQYAVLPNPGGGGGLDVTAKSLGARFQSRSRAVQGGFVYASWTQEVRKGEQG